MQVARSRFQENATKKELELSRKSKKNGQVFIKTGDTRREGKKHDKQITSNTFLTLWMTFPVKYGVMIILTKWNWNIKHLEIMSFYLV